MKRRQFIQYAGAGLGTAIGFNGLATAAQGQSSTVQIRWFGHTCFSFTGDGQTLLVNPFQPIGCTAGYQPPRVTADVVMISSRLLDEGAVEGLPGNPRVLSETGIFQISGLRLEGIPIDHDRVGGRRFGTNVMWNWRQGGLNILHMGGAAGPIAFEQQILIGRPDVLLIPVGGGVKAYNPEEAIAAINALNPKVIIPTHYRTAAADDNACDIKPLDDFLALLSNTPITRLTTDTIALGAADLPTSGRSVRVFRSLV
jgi:L-ascorbate metabolism protein UlaG (beta-lactamase superfamily)